MACDLPNLSAYGKTGKQDGHTFCPEIKNRLRYKADGQAAEASLLDGQKADVKKGSEVG